jgi:GntR family transcriptional regulator
MAKFRADERTIVERLRDGLVELIEERGLLPGDKVPTEFELCSEFNVSRPTLREALKLLEQDDMIRVERGKGRFVTARSALRAERPITRFESATQMVRAAGFEPTTSVLSVSTEPATGEFARELGCSPGELLVRLERLRSNPDRAILYSVDRFPLRLVETALANVDWTGSLVDLLTGWGHRPVMSSARASAVSLPEGVAELDGLRDFGPALLIAETCFTKDGQPVIHALDYHRGDAFSFSFVRT